MGLILSFLLFLLLFVSENLYTSSISLPITFQQYQMLLFVLSAFLLIFNYCKNNHFFLVELFGFVLLITRPIIIGRDGVFLAVISLVGAPVICHLYYSVYLKKRAGSIERIFNLFILFFVIECFIAIYERITNSLIFGWTLGDRYFESFGDDNRFRSTALLGHPLMNALIVSTIMSFILFSHIKSRYKYLLWSIGYLSILCFNTRSSMVGNAAILFLFILSEIFSSKKNKSKIGYFLSGLAFLGIIFYILSNTSLGGRLIEKGLFDDSSAQVRIDVWMIFQYLDINEFMWGHTYEVSRDLVLKVGLYDTENFWIDWVMTYGIFFTAVYVLIMFGLIKHLYKALGYKKIQILGTSATFFLIASTNNSLSAGYLPSLIFFMCLILFSPKYEGRMPRLFYR